MTPDYDNDDDEIDLGICCHCGGSENVRNLVMLSRLAPVPGYGWGCVVCNLPPNGAVAVLCDDCVEADKPVLTVIHGELQRRERTPISELSSEPFWHDEMQHPETETRSE